ncbi:MAG TPA: PfkB family carbohydrate kinase [Melioribacteraceae bacterium]|nr:PfkB family carbohydrate kinase [Melioribacteraceae bacterium]
MKSKNDLLVVGSIAFDTVETPFDKVENALGGSTTYITIAAGYFTKPVNIIGVVGEDFEQKYINLLKNHNGNLDYLEIIKGGKTFRWGGKYHLNFNDRDTLFTDLNVFENFNPIIPEELKESKYIMLGNIDPVLQLNVIAQLKNPKFIIVDSMNLWINIRFKELIEVISKADLLIINDSEARMISKEHNTIQAAEKIISLGCKNLIIKKGEHGALLFNGNEVFSAPALPLKSIIDPTGAGDTFAGGLAGYIASTDDISFENLKKGVIYGSVLASFNVEKFSTLGIENLKLEQINDRYVTFKKLSSF